MATKSIYALIDPRDDSIRYIGASNNPDKRYRQHLSRSGPPAREVIQWLDDLESTGHQPGLRTLVGPTEEWSAVEQALKAKYSGSLLGRDDRPREIRVATHKPKGRIREQSLTEWLEAKRTLEKLRPLIGGQIRNARESLGMTQTELARAIDSPQAYVSQIENSSKTPSSETLGKIANVFMSVGGMEDGNEENGAEEDSA